MKHELRIKPDEREMELVAQLSDATSQCEVMAELLRTARTHYDTALENGDFSESSDIEYLVNQIDEIDAALAGKLPEPAVTVTETIRTAPERIWLQVGDQPGDHDYPFPEHGDGVSWFSEQVMPCEVPYVRVDLAGQWPDYSAPDALVTISDIASIQRYTLGGHCDSFGQDCGSEMEPDDEGEYIMLAEALALFPSKNGE